MLCCEPGDLRTKAAGKLDNAQGNLVLERAEIYYVHDFKMLVTINSETFYSIFFMMSPPHSVVSPYMRHYYVIAAGVN